MNIEAPQIVPSEKSTFHDCPSPMSPVSGRWKRAETAILFRSLRPSAVFGLGPGIRELGYGRRRVRPSDETRSACNTHRKRLLDAAIPQCDAGFRAQFGAAGNSGRCGGGGGGERRRWRRRLFGGRRRRPRRWGRRGSYVSSLFTQDVTISPGGNSDTTGQVVIQSDACTPDCFVSYTGSVQYFTVTNSGFTPQFIIIGAGGGQGGSNALGVPGGQGAVAEGEFLTPALRPWNSRLLSEARAALAVGVAVAARLMSTKLPCPSPRLGR